MQRHGEGHHEGETIRRPGEGPGFVEQWTMRQSSALHILFVTRAVDYRNCTAEYIFRMLEGSPQLFAGIRGSICVQEYVRAAIGMLRSQLTTLESLHQNGDDDDSAANSPAYVSPEIVYGTPVDEVVNSTAVLGQIRGRNVTSSESRELSIGVIDESVRGSMQHHHYRLLVVKHLEVAFAVAAVIASRSFVKRIGIQAESSKAADILVKLQPHKYEWILEKTSLELGQIDDVFAGMSPFRIQELYGALVMCAKSPKTISTAAKMMPWKAPTRNQSRGVNDMVLVAQLSALTLPREMKDKKLECHLCCERAIDCIATPCMHMVCCSKCAESLESCSICMAACTYETVYGLH